MFLKRASSAGSVFFLTAAMLAVFLGLLSWGSAQAVATSPTAVTILATTLQQGTPMTATDHTGHNMPETGRPMTGTMPAGAPAADEHAQHTMPAAEAGSADMPMQPGEGMAGMGAMMAKMADMQGMMARMQRMMGSDMMGSGMPMSADMQKSMGEMMSMMGEMQGMMADMQGMMAGDMMSGGMSDMGKMQGQEMSQMGGQQMGGQQMGGQQMGQMPMMGTMVVIMPVPMNGGMGQMPMMQGGMDMGKMMGQMPMMQGGMDMGGMMGGQDAPQGSGPNAAAAPKAEANPAAAPQTATLGDIEVKVTPPDLTNIQGETIDFTVDLNATGADLSFDLAKQATLLVGDHKMPAEAWEVTLDHGHHVAGVLKFPAHMQGAVEGATVVFTDPAGGPDASGSWTTAE